MNRLEYPAAAYLNDLLPEDRQIESSLLVERLVMDSRQIKPGDVFIAWPSTSGKQEYAYIEAAFAAGAVAVIAPEQWTELTQYQQSGIIIQLDDFENSVGLIVAKFYQHATAKVKVVGITGTNGKTSTAHFLSQALALHGKKSATIGTIGNGFAGALIPATHTTPDVVQLHHLIYNFWLQGAEVVIMEVSSHALDQGRVAGVVFDLVALTNLSRDHLDYHLTMEAYGNSKRKLFESAAPAILNLDDELGRSIFAACRRKQKPALTYSTVDKTAEVHLHKLQQHSQGMTLYINSIWGEYAIKTPLMGEFNAKNLLLTFAALIYLGLPITAIVSILPKISAVKGRLEAINQGQKAPLVVIDYAHTPDALEQALLALKEHGQRGRIYCVMGCGGDRDKGKRALMGRVATEHADFITVTSDNPRTENPEHIIADILTGVDESKTLVEVNREKAIHQAIEAAKEKDIVLIAGKGHEDYQEIQGVKYQFSDHLVAEQALMARSVA